MVPTTHGTDEAEEPEEGTRVLVSASPRGWRVPAPARPRVLAIPGTAVLWDGEAWEVVEAVPLPDARGTRYRLHRWERTEVLRDPEPYPPPPPRAGGFMKPLEAGEVITPEEAARRHDLYHVRVPFLAFLPAADQERLSALYGFDPVRSGKRSAWFVLAFAALQVVVAVRQIDAGSAPFFPRTAIAVALYLAAEQAFRFARFARREAAGSALGMVVRPFSRVLLPPR